METPVTVLQRHFDLADIDDDAAAFLSSRSWDEWREFATLYKEQYVDHFVDLNQEELGRREDESSPYLFEYFKYGDALAIPMGATSRDPDLVVTALKRLLLFHHRVFVPDWFLWLLDFPRLGTARWKHAPEYLAIINEYVKVVCALAPLFEAGIINFIPTEALGISGIPVGRFQVDVDREWLRKFSEVATDDDLDVHERIVSGLLNNILVYVETANKLDVDLMLPNRQWSQIFDHAITETTKPQLNVMESLLMPGLDRIHLRDLVSLRENDEDFEKWRDELRQIQQIARLDPNAVEHPEEFAADVSARLRSRRDAIRSGSAAKSFAATIAAKVSTIGFSVLGALGANLLVPGGGLVTSVLGTFVGGSAGVAVDAARHVTKHSKRDVLVRTYSVFDAS